jgi:hypothetical protein
MTEPEWMANQKPEVRVFREICEFESVTIYGDTVEGRVKHRPRTTYSVSRYNCRSITYRHGQKRKVPRWVADAIVAAFPEVLIPASAVTEDAVTP